MSEFEKYGQNLFDSIKHIDDQGNEYWNARELMSCLDYVKWQRFKDVINKAKLTCENSNYLISDHFTDVGKIVHAGVTNKSIDDYKLSRYACYLIAQNGDSRKKVIALAKTYFAIQTRKQELSEEEYKILTEDEKRLYRRKQASDGNLYLYKMAKKKGVKCFDKFTNSGYRGLYNGETADDIAKRKGLRYHEDILDNMGSAELGANIFRITQTEVLLGMQEEPDEDKANKTHYRVGKAIRETMKKIGVPMPEKLSTPKKSIKELKNRNNLKIENNKTSK